MHDGSRHESESRKMIIVNYCSLYGNFLMHTRKNKMFEKGGDGRAFFNFKNRFRLKFNFFKFFLIIKIR